MSRRGSPRRRGVLGRSSSSRAFICSLQTIVSVSRDNSLAVFGTYLDSSRRYQWLRFYSRALTDIMKLSAIIVLAWASIVLAKSEVLLVRYIPQSQEQLVANLHI